MSGQSRYARFMRDVVSYDLIYKRNVAGHHALPRLDKLSLNSSSGKAVNDKNHVLGCMAALQLITGQKATPTHLHQPVSTWRVRAGQIIGARTTLRNDKAWDFIEKLNLFALPSNPEWPGLNKKSFNVSKPATRTRHLARQTTTMSFGLTNMLAFPELEPMFEYFDSIPGMDVTMVFRALSPKDLSAFLPLRQNVPPPPAELAEEDAEGEE